MWERDTAYLNADLIDQVKWMLDKDCDMRPSLKRMWDSRVETHGESLAMKSMSFWVYVADTALGAN